MDDSPLIELTPIQEKRGLPPARKSPDKENRRGNVYSGNFGEKGKDMTEDNSLIEMNRRSFPKSAPSSGPSTGNLTALPPSSGINQNRLQSTSLRMQPLPPTPLIDDSDEALASLSPAQRYSFNLKKKEESFKAELLSNRSKDAIPAPPRDSMGDPKIPFVSDRQSGRDLDKWRETEKRKSQDGADSQTQGLGPGTGTGPDPGTRTSPGTGTGTGPSTTGAAATTLSSASLSARNRPSSAALSRGASVDGPSLYGALVTSSESPEPPGPLSLFRSFPPSDTSSNSPGTPYYEEHPPSPPSERERGVPSEQILSLDSIYSDPSALGRSDFNSPSSSNISNSNTGNHGSNLLSANVDTQSYPVALSPLRQLNISQKLSEQAQANQLRKLSRASADEELERSSRL